MTASFGTLAWPLFLGYWARLQVREAPVSTFPRIKPRGAQKTKINLFGHLRTACADLIELALNRLLGDSLFHDHRIAAIHLRNRLPYRHRVERLAGPECLDQCLSLVGHLLAELRLCRRRSRLNQKIAKVGVIAISAPSRRASAIGFRRRRPFRRLGSPFAFHIQSPFPSAYLRLPNPACCSTQSRFSPSIARSQYSPISNPLGFCSDRFSMSSLTWNSLTTLSMVSLCS